ncbi:MAG: hypothetical protein HGB05_16260 [Chloroflexi bacterium]|nr:hypothetical protein [Chloroflexota bacterium]
MDASTTQEIKAAYRALYDATANAMQANKAVTAYRYALKDAEAVLIAPGNIPGKNAEERAANLYTMTAAERAELRNAENALAGAEMEQALAKIAVNELRELLRLAEFQLAYVGFGYDNAAEIPEAAF